MHNTSLRYQFMACVAAAAFGLALIPGTASAQNQTQNQSPDLDQRVMNALHECQRVSTSCATTTQNAPGILVFPSVIKADLIVGGAGGKGALIENGRITGYYNIGAASAGLQAGADQASQVYVFRTPQALEKLKSGSDWKVGASAGVTVVNANASAAATNGNTLCYVFDSHGLHGGVAVNVFDVWKAGTQRPQTATP